MGAYTKVDNSTRRKMDEMLKTWKEPVPGSISTKPVFPLEQVRPIEHALMAARNAAYAAQQTSYQGQQQLMRGRQAAPPRDTPTPPTGRGYPPPGQQHQQQQQQQQSSYSGSNGQQRQDAAQKQYQNHPASVRPLFPQPLCLGVTICSCSVLTILLGPKCHPSPSNSPAHSAHWQLPPLPAAGRRPSLWHSQVWRNKHRQVEE